MSPQVEGYAVRRAMLKRLRKLRNIVKTTEQGEYPVGLVDELIHTISEITRGHLYAAELRIAYLVEKLRDVK